MSFHTNAQICPSYCTHGTRIQAVSCQGLKALRYDVEFTRVLFSRYRLSFFLHEYKTLLIFFVENVWLFL